MLATKTIEYYGEKSIVTQNENGPCSLVALVNALVLVDSPLAVHLQDKEYVSTNDLIERMVDLVDEKSDLASVLKFLPLSIKGLDINPDFTGTFAESPELGLFRAFNITLVHGWVLGEKELEQCISVLDQEDALSFNPATGKSQMLLDRLSRMNYEEYCGLSFKKPDSLSAELNVLSEFLSRYPSQLTESGLERLLKTLTPETPVVLFRNNHYSTIILRDGVLYSLVTDQGYRGRSDIVWETLTNTYGAESFVLSDFSTFAGDPDTSGDAVLAQKLEEKEKEETRETKKPLPNASYSTKPKLREFSSSKPISWRRKVKDRCIVT